MANPIGVQRLITDAMCRFIHDLVAAGEPSRETLVWLHQALDPQAAGKEWHACLALDVLRLEVDAALARSYGAEPEDLNTLPDFPPDGVT